MNKRMVFAGVGGQGIVLATRLIGITLTRLGVPVISTENHGMATRGGSVLAFLKTGNYHSPLICYGEADIAVILHPDESGKVEPYLNRKTFTVAYGLEKPTLDLKKILEKKDVHPKLMNVVAVGAILKHLGIDLHEGLKSLEHLGKNNDSNIKALEIGYTEA